MLIILKKDIRAFFMTKLSVGSGTATEFAR